MSGGDWQIKIKTVWSYRPSHVVDGIPLQGVQPRRGVDLDYLRSSLTPKTLTQELKSRGRTVPTRAPPVPALDLLALLIDFPKTNSTFTGYRTWEVEGVAGTLSDRATAPHMQAAQRAAVTRATE